MKLVFSIVEAILFPLIGLGSMFLIYICLLWCVVVTTTTTTTTTRHSVSTTTTTTNSEEEPLPPPVIKPLSNNGLSLSELQNLPNTKTGKLDDDDLHECSVCLDEICIEQAARIIPGCNHTFHLECADRWLSNNRFCPLCRTQLN